MIMIKFFLLEPGNHHQIDRAKLPAVPRNGEIVTIKDRSRRVHSVDWDVDKSEVRVNLDAR